MSCGFYIPLDAKNQLQVIKCSKKWWHSLVSRGTAVARVLSVVFANLPDAHCWFWGRLGSGDREQTVNHGDIPCDITLAVEHIDKL